MQKTLYDPKVFYMILFMIKYFFQLTFIES